MPFSQHWTYFHLSPKKNFTFLVKKFCELWSVLRQKKGVGLLKKKKQREKLWCFGVFGVPKGRNETRRHTCLFIGKYKARLTTSKPT